MKSMIRFSGSIFVVLSFTLLLLSGCGGGGATAPAGFATDQVAGKTFAYASAPDATNATGATGAITFDADGTWRCTLAPSVFSGTWTIDANGKLVCVTTAGGDHTITYTLLDATSGALKVSAVEVNPAEPTTPSNYTATFSTAFTIEMIAGQKLSYSSGSANAKGTIEFHHDGSWEATTGTASYIGTWNVVDGKLVCVTTTGGDHTLTYTRLDATANPLRASASEVAPATPNAPVISAVTFTMVDTLVTAWVPTIFNFTVTFKNLPASLPQTESTTPYYTVIPQRRYWIFFVPCFDYTARLIENFQVNNYGSPYNYILKFPTYWPDPDNEASIWGARLYPNGIPDGDTNAGFLTSYADFNPYPVSGTTVSFGFFRAFMVPAYSGDNYFRFKVIYPTATGNREFTTPLMGFLLGNAPDNSSWVYDHADKSMKRIN